MKICIYGNEVLRQTAPQLECMTDDDRILIERMAETLYRNKGIGLAANQVGVLKRIAVIDVEQLTKSEGGAGKPFLRVFVNPCIVSESDEDESFNEGCLSLPGIDGNVYRPGIVEVQYHDLDFEPHRVTFDGLLARVIQHEIDHLNGKLFIDHLSFLRRSALAGQLSKLKKVSKS